ncbi:MAG: hypothetical protein ACI9WU_001972, partial [Myxococcota bacterium]
MTAALSLACVLFESRSAQAQTCPADAGIPCDGTADDDLCAEGTIDCTSGTPVCVGEGPLVFLPFDEGSGSNAINKADAPSGTDATLLGVTWTPGIVGQALSWTGGSINQWVRLPLADAQATTFTWAFWARPTAIGGNYIISRTAIGTSNAFAYAVNGDMFLGGGSIISSGKPLSAATWTHVAITWDGSVLRLYYDAALQFEAPKTSPNLAWDSDVWLGQEQDATNGGLDPAQAYSGQLDDVYYYDYALDVAGVTTLVATGESFQRLNREVCDDPSQSDNDCNPATIDPFGTACDGGDSDSCINGTVTCGGGGLLNLCLNEIPANIPETCNFLDDDCNGSTDDGLGVGVACDGADPDTCSGGRTTCSGAQAVICGVEPVAYYTFDVGASGTNTVTDLTSWHSEAMLRGGASVSTDGKFSSGVAFDGTNDFLRPYGSDRIRAMTNSATVAGWIHPTSATEGTLFYKLNSFNVVRKADGQLAITNKGALAVGAPAYDKADINTWTHVAATVQGGTLSMYVNGVLAGSHTTDLSVPETDPVSASASFVGCRGGGKWFCNGSFF